MLITYDENPLEIIKTDERYFIEDIVKTFNGQLTDK